MLLPLSDIFNRQSISSKLRLLNESQFWTKEQIISFQNERLRLLINYVSQNVPYYKCLFKELGLKPGDIQRKEELIKLPILDKHTIKQNGIIQFTSSSISKRDIIKSSSSGSTGEPLFYYRTRDSYSISIASSLRGWYWMGYRLGDKYIKLSQNPRNFFFKRVQDNISRNNYLATNPLIDSNLNFILKEIERYQPKIIRCYPDPLLFLARYKQEHPEFIYKPLAITTTGNTLHKETRSEIESAFECKVFDAYSCEGNSSVFECPSHTCYHSAEEYGISEVIDENGEPITSGIGRLISTDLWNLAHPFIRYDTQDIVEVDSEPCICGRQHLKILRILGRDNDIIETETGRKFIVHNFTGFFQTDTQEINRSVDQFQVVKKGSKIIFKLVTNSFFNEDVSSFIIKYWEREMQTKVEIQIVENIPLTKNGKRKFILIQ